MGDHHNSFPVLPTQRAEEIKDPPGGFSIEVPGGFVCDQKIWIVNNSPRDSDSLFLSPR